MIIQVSLPSCWAKNLVEREDPVDLLPGDGLRDGDLPLVVVAGDHLRRVAPEFVVAERPAAEKDLDVHRLLLVQPRHGGGGGGGLGDFEIPPVPRCGVGDSETFGVERGGGLGFGRGCGEFKILGKWPPSVRSCLEEERIWEADELT